MSIAGTESIINGINKYVVSKIQDIISHIYKQGEYSTYILQITQRKSVLNFLNYIYNDATIYLERKYKRYKMVLDNTPLKYEDFTYVINNKKKLTFAKNNPPETQVWEG
jgi:hypothetical protein